MLRREGAGQAAEIPVFTPERSATKRIGGSSRTSRRFHRRCRVRQILPSVPGCGAHRAGKRTRSLLPRYRGAAPVIWTLLNGDPITGVTTMWMDEHLDTGTCCSAEFPVRTPSPPASSRGIGAARAGLSCRHWTACAPGASCASRRITARRRRAADRQGHGADRLAASAPEIHNLVRAFNPGPWHARNSGRKAPVSSQPSAPERKQPCSPRARFWSVRDALRVSCGEEPLSICSGFNWRAAVRLGARICQRAHLHPGTVL